MKTRRETETGSEPESIESLGSVPLTAAGLERIEPAPNASPWPAPIGPAARMGLAGEIVAAVEPLTEADPNAVLVQLLAALGNLIGNGPHLLIGEKRHALRVWALVVGSTASGKKGTAASVVFALLDEVDPAWAACRKAGIASGEAVVHSVRDDIERVRRVRHEDGTVAEKRESIEGVRDKRLLLLEEEFGRVLRLSRKEGTTISATLREAWDRDTLMTTAKTAPERATGAHVTVIGHITPEELRRELSAAEIANGFANRFLFACSRRSKHLSFPEPMDRRLRDDLVGRLRRVLERAGAVSQGETSESRITLSTEALELWDVLKREIEDDAERADAVGLVLGKVTTRGAPYVLRLAALYATLDFERTIAPAHLQAAREVWRYSVDSARTVFGDDLSSPDARRVLAALQEAEDRMLTRLRVHEILSRHRSAAEITRLRDLLITSGRIEAFVERGLAGRKTEWWCGR